MTLSPILVPRQFRDINNNIVTNLVQVYDGGTIQFNEDSIGEAGVFTCYYGKAHTPALDDTAQWGIGPTTDRASTCWNDRVFDFDFDANFYFGADIIVQHFYRGPIENSRSYLRVTVRPRFQSITGPAPDFIQSKGAAVDSINNFVYAFDIEANFDYEGPYRECEGPAYSTSQETCHGATTANLNYSDPEPSMCECWSNDNGGGCQFDSVSPFSNMILDLDNEATRTQNAASYWELDDAGSHIAVPFDNGTIGRFYPIADQLTGINGIGAGKYISLGEDGAAGSVPFALDACEGNIQGTGYLNPNSIFTVDVTNGSDCT